MDELPDYFDANRLAFLPSDGKAFNIREIADSATATFVFGYFDQTGDWESRAVTIIEEREVFALEIRSMLWRIAEIDVERQGRWLVFSRIQNELSAEALQSFLVDSRNLQKHLQDEDKRLNPHSS